MIIDETESLNLTYSHLWEQIPGKLKHVCISKNFIWGVNVHDDIYMRPYPISTSSPWKCMGGKLRQVDCNNYEVWGVNSGDNIYSRRVDGSGGWVQISGLLKHVTASGNGWIWGTNKHDHIYRRMQQRKGAWIQVDGLLRQVEGGDQYLYGVNGAQDVYTRPVDGSSGWRHVPGKKLKYITAGGFNEIFGIDSNNHLWRSQKPALGKWEKLSGILKQFDASADAIVGVDVKDNIFIHYLT